MKQIKGFKDGIYFHTWFDSIYSTKHWVIVCPEEVSDARDFFKRITKLDLETGKGALAMCVEALAPPAENQNIFLILRAGCSMGNIVHESVHAKNYVFAFHGIKPDQDNDEHEAYYVDYLFKNAGAVIDDYWDKTNKKDGKRGRKGIKRNS
jgi:hypothetical protein